jgi:hypothetical protein
MIDILITVLALTAGGIGFSFYVASRAPMGYEDEEGFHLGPEPVRQVEEPVVCPDGVLQTGH